jgi:hypothetical protein
VPKVHTTFWPDKAIDVSEEEELDLRRQGLIEDKKAHKATKSEKETD